MGRTAVDGVEIEFETIGDPDDPAVLLICGLGAQLLTWDDDFCGGLVDRGFFVIRFDNRDVGLSTHLDRAGSPALAPAVLRAALGLPIKAPYDLGEMADDATGLLDALGLDTAHIVGVSMGGMIGQIIAAHRSGRARTLVSIMSTSGDPRLPQAHWRLRMELLRRPGVRVDRAQAIEWAIALYKRIGSPGYPPDDQLLRDQVTRDVERSYYPRGLRRQLLAILASGSRVPILGQITVPTLILHGAEDPLVPVAAAYDLQRRIRGARMQIIEGMGHDLPRALIPRVTTQIVEHLRCADAAPRADRDNGSAAS